MFRLSLLAVSVLMMPVNGALGDIDQTRQAELVYMLEQDCGSCHGLTLKGGLGPALLPQALAGKSGEWLTAVILNGIPETAMPPWKDLLSEEEADWLAHYLLRGRRTE